ncbi:DUF421 domain-containing protein [Actinopolyspora sp. H202]|uniref:DUF421 domain-containing protein n=1 Tax=Actinopolyspora sp. H202 TaxID=1500456 RepID=UPI003EE7EC4E
MFSGLITSWQALVLVVISTLGIYVAMIIFSRVAGLRSFSQMTNFDFAATVAFGSIMATTAVSSGVSLLQGIIALGMLFAAQTSIAALRKLGSFERLADNRPLLLMDGREELSRNLEHAQMTRDDLYSKLRLAGVTHLDQVQAVVLETTGEVSVLTVDPNGHPLENRMLSSVETSPESPRHAPPDPPNRNSSGQRDA